MLVESDPKIFDDTVMDGDYPSNRYFGKSYFNFCYFIRWQFGGVVGDYPELLAQKPKRGWTERPTFWWNPFRAKRRIKALDDAIELAKANLKKEDEDTKNSKFLKRMGPSSGGIFKK